MKFIDFPFAVTTLFTTSIAIVLAAFVIKIHGNRLFDKKRKYHPVAGTVLHQMFNFHRLLEYMTDLTNKRKTYRLLSFTRSEVYTSNPANIEHILLTNFSNYGKGWYHHGVLEDLLGDGIFTVDGEQWRHQRKSASYQFSTKLLREFSSSVFKSSLVKLAGIVSEAAISNNIIELQDLFMKSTLDSVFKIILGVELDTMWGTYREGAEFSIAYNAASEAIMFRYVNFFWKVQRFLNIGSEAVVTPRFSKTKKGIIFFSFSFSTNTQSAHRIFSNEPAFKYTKDSLPKELALASWWRVKAESSGLTRPGARPGELSRPVTLALASNHSPGEFQLS
ncbi:hypothetical protein P8452_13746 [Trifolium repens]|nr:hypothetical protein P8452_13746 [Trifolium repens]